MTKRIEFTCHEEFLKHKKNFPTPIKLNIPEWYKKLDHTPTKRTIKGCIPFLETLTTGYILKLPQDIYFEHNTRNDKGEARSVFQAAYRDYQSLPGQEFALNIQSEDIHTHPVVQVGEECPYGAKNKHLPFQKIINPWWIKTPPGYSCLFTAPLNNHDDRFSIVAGIVNTDTFPHRINFPFIVNGDKYPYLKTTLQAGLPYVQVIPFKRDNWQMKIKSKNQVSVIKSLRLFSDLKTWIYKTYWWNKSNFK
jgi:hypothetical protein